MGDIRTRRRELVEGALAPGTRRTYQRWWEEFERFLGECGRSVAQASGRDVGDFLAWLDLSGRGGSADVAKAAIAYRLRSEGLADATACFEVEAIVRAMRKGTGSRHTKIRRDPFPLEALAHWWRFGRGDRWWLRDVALVAGGFRMLRRASELAALRVGDVAAERSGVRVTVRRSKTDQEGRGVTLRVEASGAAMCPAHLLTCQARARREEGATDDDLLFVKEGGRPLTSQDITAILRRMVSAAGGREAVSSHSLRIGGATAAMNGGLTKEQVMALGCWSSPAVERYLRDEEIVRLCPTQRMGFAQHAL